MQVGRRWAARALVLVVVLAVLGPNLALVVRELPYGVHSWKQGDCLALAERFLEDDNWNILDPRGLSLFSQEGRVNAELPLTPYLAAGVCRVLGDSWLMPMLRVLTFLLSLIGPLALFAMVQQRASSLWIAMLPAVFLASCPIYAYYAATSVPDPAALSIWLLGLAVLVRPNGPPRDVWLVTGVGLMTLAGLMKMSLAPYMLVALAVVADATRKRVVSVGRLRSLASVPVAPWIALACSGLALAGQVVLLKVRATSFGQTHFTASAHPFQSWDHVTAVVLRMTREWLEFLFTSAQLGVVAVAIVVVGWWAFSRQRADLLGVVTAVSAVVSAALFVLFGQQLAWHDYYAIAVFYPTAALLVVRLAVAIGDGLNRSQSSRLRTTALLAVLIVIGVQAVHVQSYLERRRHPWFREHLAWQVEARRALDRCGAACHGPVAVVGVEPPNLVLTYLGRRGYVLGPVLGSAQAPAVQTPGDLAEFVDARDVRVVVFTAAALAPLPQAEMRALFRVAEREGRAVVLVRRRMSAAVVPPPSAEGHAVDVLRPRYAARTSDTSPIAR